MSKWPVDGDTTLRRVWVDESLSLNDMARELGVTCTTVSNHAAQLELPRRKSGRRHFTPVMRNSPAIKSEEHGISQDHEGARFQRNAVEGTNELLHRLRIFHKLSDVVNA